MHQLLEPVIVCGAKLSLAHASLKLRMLQPLRSMETPMLTDFFLYPVFMVLTWTMFSFNRMMQHAPYLKRQFLRQKFDGRFISCDLERLDYFQSDTGKKAICRQTTDNRAFEGQRSWCRIHEKLNENWYWTHSRQLVAVIWMK